MRDKISLLIIAGGKSSRLGVDKRFVQVGGVGMLEKILLKSSAIEFAEKFLCVEEELPSLKILADRYGAKILVDEIREAGAMSGIANGLSLIRPDRGVVVVDGKIFVGASGRTDCRRSSADVGGVLSS